MKTFEQTIKDFYSDWNTSFTGIEVAKILEKVTTENLTEFSKDIHKGNVKRGFYDDPKEIGTVLMLIVTELAEAMESYRGNNRLGSGRLASLEWDSLDNTLNEDFSQEDINQFRAVVKDTFEDEIADTIIRLFDLCGWMNIDIHKHIILKLKYNSTRPYKHGKAF
jgi:NTP pyrophosphatase (non-canonical NTP hydrolase)